VTPAGQPAGGRRYEPMPNDFSIIGKPMPWLTPRQDHRRRQVHRRSHACLECSSARFYIPPTLTPALRVLTSPALEKLDGVIAVATGKDAPNTYGILPVGHDEHALAVR